MAYPYYPIYSPWAQYNTPQQPTMSYNAFSNQGSNVHAPAPINAQSATSGFTWVQGVEGAKAHVVPAGVSALLMDSEKERFYIKGSDASGMPLPLRVFEYKEIKETESAVADKPSAEYVTKEEFEKFKAEIKELTNERTVSSLGRYERKAGDESISDASPVEKRSRGDVETGRTYNSGRYD